MAAPKIYYANAFRLGTITGPSALVTNPVRRVADSDQTLRYTVFDSVGPSPTSGVVSGVLSTAATREAFVMVRGTALSGWTVQVESQDVGGGNNSVHGSSARSGDSSFLIALSGTSTPRREWLARFTSESGIETSAIVYEMMIAKELVFPHRPLAGVMRTTVQNYQRLDVPGAAPFKLRLGEDFRRTSYNMTLTEDETSEFQAFVSENDGGEPFWFVDDLGESYWAEMRDANVAFDDQAGIYSFTLVVQEIPLEL